MKRRRRGAIRSIVAICGHFSPMAVLLHESMYICGRRIGSDACQIYPHNVSSQDWAWEAIAARSQASLSLGAMVTCLHVTTVTSRVEYMTWSERICRLAPKHRAGFVETEAPRLGSGNPTELEQGLIRVGYLPTSHVVALAIIDCDQPHQGAPGARGQRESVG